MAFHHVSDEMTEGSRGRQQNLKLSESYCVTFYLYSFSNLLIHNIKIYLRGVVYEKNLYPLRNSQKKKQKKERGFIISCLLSMTGFCSVCEDIQKDVFRLHILANSDTQQDQTLKLKVRDGILDYTAELFKNCQSREQAIGTAEKILIT